MAQTAIRAKKLLRAVAEEKELRVKKINKDEIKKKISEIKYLSTQKNVPRLSLRKEIVHLEQKLQHVFELEEKLLKSENKDSLKVVSLKKQIESLKNRLNHTEDKELRDKVSKLYHILTELLAKSELKRDVALSQSLLRELKNVDPKQGAKEVKEMDNDASLKVRRVAMLLHRIKSVKHELELKLEMMSSDPQGLAKLKEQIAELEAKIGELSLKYPEAAEELKVQEAPLAEDEPGIKHTMMMGAPEIPINFGPGTNMSDLEIGVQANGAINANEELHVEEDIISELPLPPPPRIRKK